MQKTVILLVAAASLAAARIIYVPDSVSTVQAGIMQAAEGDTVLLAPGTYTETVNLLGKRITLGSQFILTGDTSAIRATAIDANRVGTVVKCCSTENTTTNIIGLTLRNGYDTNGSGIFCRGGSPTIRYNIIEDNQTEADGAGIMVTNEAAPIIEYNIIRRNTTPAWGGGIYIFDGSSPLVRRNVIYNNGSLAQAPLRSSKPAFVAGRLVGRDEPIYQLATAGGGILVTNYQGLVTRPVIHHNTIYGNRVDLNGGGVFSNRAEPDIRNNIMTSNHGYGVYAMGTAVVCPYNDVWNNTTDYGGTASAGPGAISADPLFVDSAGRDFHILPGSPCIDAGDPSLPKDPDSTRADIGAFWCLAGGIAAPGSETPKPRLRVCPNPFTGGTTVRPEGLVLIRDAAGRLVETSNTGRFGMKLAPGVYFVEMSGYDRARVVKLTR